MQQPEPTLTYGNMTYRLCPKCKWEGESDEKLCPRCRKPTQTTGFLRATGALLVVLGGILVAGISAITIATIGVIEQTGKPGATSKFTGSKDMMIVMFAIFGFVLLFGFVSLIAGLWQLVFGRRSTILIYIILALGAVFLIGGTMFRAFVGD